MRIFTVHAAASIPSRITWRRARYIVHTVESHCSARRYPWHFCWVAGPVSHSPRSFTPRRAFKSSHLRGSRVLVFSGRLASTRRATPPIALALARSIHTPGRYLAWRRFGSMRCRRTCWKVCLPPATIFKRFGAAAPSARRSQVPAAAACHSGFHAAHPTLQRCDVQCGPKVRRRRAPSWLRVGW